ncbi:MAG: hypothetical protein H6658_04540 [Ardenticatenaceae bacterium]|nr:hypothetical protein [Ardenticatenaceae bacterium]
MLSPRRRTPLIAGVLLLILAIVIILLLTRRTQAAVGPAIALCPGPDLYGYTCESGAGFAYIDATTDTFLYQDDGIITLPLPFPFTFYGTTYTELQASSNGNLQFGNDNSTYLNGCMDSGPVPEMGDLIAPFWDDLDLTLYGYLETITVGEAPNRIFVIEWDNIPPFQAEPEDAVTFEVQLFEGSHDIVFLYEDVLSFERSNGRSATIGLQSEAQGVSLQYSCDRPAMNDAAGLYFPHPAAPNNDLGLDVVIEQEITAVPQAKGHINELLTSLAQHGPASLTDLRHHWLSQTPQLITDWHWLDLAGNGRNDLILLWRGTAQQPELTQLVVLTPDEAGQMSVQLNQRLATRQETFAQLTMAATADLTHDNNPDVLLHDAASGQLLLLTHTRGQLDLIPVPEQCTGKLAVVDSDGDGRWEIARDGCEGGRVVLAWNGRSFTTK